MMGKTTIRYHSLVLFVRNSCFYFPGLVSWWFWDTLSCTVSASLFVFLLFACLKSLLFSLLAITETDCEEKTIISKDVAKSALNSSGVWFWMDGFLTNCYIPVAAEASVELIGKAVNLLWCLSAFLWGADRGGQLPVAYVCGQSSWTGDKQTRAAAMMTPKDQLLIVMESLPSCLCVVHQ